MHSILIRERKNTGGSATLLLPSNHPLRDGFPAFKTPVTIYRDGVLRWRGRALPESRDFYCRGKIVCEGELCFLQDSILRPGSYSGNLATIFTHFIEAHNARVEEWKRFTVGSITVETDENVEITLKEAQKTYTAVQNLASAYGGIILFDSASDGTRRINWYAEMPYSCNQKISLGTNLTGYSSDVDVSGFATRIVPYGADVDGQPLTINVDGKDYVESSEGVTQRGIIEASVNYPNISDPEELRIAAQRDVDKAATLPETIKLSALDTSRQNLRVEAFRMGQRVEAESVPHKLSGYYDLVAMEEDLVSPGAGSITLAKDATYCTGASNSLTGTVSSQHKEIKKKTEGVIKSTDGTLLLDLIRNRFVISMPTNGAARTMNFLSSGLWGYGEDTDTGTLYPVLLIQPAVLGSKGSKQTTIVGASGADLVLATAASAYAEAGFVCIGTMPDSKVKINGKTVSWKENGDGTFTLVGQ